MPRLNSNNTQNYHDFNSAGLNIKKKQKKRFAAIIILAVCFGCSYYENHDSDSFMFGGKGEDSGILDRMSRRMSVVVPTPSRKKADQAETSFMAKLPMFSFGEIKRQLRQATGSVDKDVGRSSRSTNQRSLRELSLDLGNGNCAWTPPAALPETTPIESTFLVGFPGSGKRMTYLLLEALTGNWAGDDWDHSGNGYHVAQMKGAYPHHESTAWFWGSQMDHTVMQIRNPRWALPSYRTLRHELNYSETWSESHDRMEYVYTKRGPVQSWDNWKANNFKQEMQIWGWFIDFWMESGLRRRFDHTPIVVGNETLIDEHCEGDLDCKPRTVVSFENMYDAATGPTELGKIANVMIGNDGIDMIGQSTWDCLYHEVVAQGDQYESRFNPYRDLQDGPKRMEKSFNSTELAFMLDEVEYIHDKYQLGDWADDPIAQQLVGYLTTYISQISAEYAMIIMQEG